MKLRNKKTGEIVDFLTIDLIDPDEMEFTYLQASGHENSWGYNSLEKFNEEWEDYTPAEPLIKDEKIRKVVRAWADGNMATRVQYDAFWRGFRNRDSSITVWEELPLEDNETYTIAELCGEEE